MGVQGTIQEVEQEIERSERQLVERFGRSAQETTAVGACGNVQVGDYEASLTTEDGDAIRVQILHQGEPLCWDRALYEMERSEKPLLRDLLTRVLREAPFKSFFWECAPVSSDNRHTDRFEFI